MLQHRWPWWLLQLGVRAYTFINNGAYRAGFASEQGAYDVAFDKFFAALDRAEAILDESR